jgi:hypothetical protein
VAAGWTRILGVVVVLVAVVLLSIGVYTGVRIVRDPSRLHGVPETLNVTYAGPNASFTWRSVGYNVTFVDTSSDNGSTITTWAWDFGDGTYSTAESPPPHTYTETCGTCVVNVTLGVEDALGRRSAATANVVLERTGEANGTGLSPVTRYRPPSLGPLTSGLPQALESVGLMLLIGASVGNAGRHLLRREPEGTPVPVRALGDGPP